jgi:hypothetical protein
LPLVLGSDAGKLSGDKLRSHVAADKRGQEMAFGDKLKNIAKQAQEAVGEHKDQIHNAVDAVSVAADRKTKGKYTDKIAKVGQKAGDAVDKLSGNEPDGGETAAPTAATGPAAAPPTPTAPVSEAPASAPEPPPAA